jgi:hypothetical protein
MVRSALDRLCLSFHQLCRANSTFRAHNGIPEFMQNLGYVGLSPNTGLDMQNPRLGGQRLDEGQNDGNVGSGDLQNHNIYAGRGLNTVLEQYLDDVLGAGNGNGSGNGR